MMGVVLALVVARVGMVFLDAFVIAMQRDDIQHRRREAGEGFYDKRFEGWR